jgi:hypothetical protein
MMPIEELNTKILMSLKSEAENVCQLIDTKLSFYKDDHVFNFKYLIKCSLLFHDKDCTEMWQSTINSINKYLYDSNSTGVWYSNVDMNTSKRNSTQFGPLYAFFPEPLCLDDEIQRARELGGSCYKIWNIYGIEPEQFNYSTITKTMPGFYLRLEIIESAYYLYTQDPRYFLAEILKYFYLLIAPPKTLNFDRVIFNTKARPIQKTWSSSDTKAINNGNFNLYQNYPNPFIPCCYTKNI